MTVKQYIWRPPGILSFVLIGVFVEILSRIQEAGYISDARAGAVSAIAVPLILMSAPWLVILILWRGSSVKPKVEAILFSALGTCLFIYTVYRLYTVSHH